MELEGGGGLRYTLAHSGPTVYHFLPPCRLLTIWEVEVERSALSAAVFGKIQWKAPLPPASGGLRDEEKSSRAKPLFWFSLTSQASWE